MPGRAGGGRKREGRRSPSQPDSSSLAQVVRKVRQLRKAPGPPALKRYLQRSASRRSGYAFSHQQGFGDLITSGRNMRLKSPAAGSAIFSPSAQKYRPRLEKKEGGAS